MPALPGSVGLHAGGLHHAHPDHASGFCTFNDLALGIKHARAHGCRKVLYVDFWADF